MTDARLLATNPENSSLVPVACNAQGQLLVSDVQIEEIPNDVNLDGDLTVTGAFTCGDSLKCTLLESTDNAVLYVGVKPSDKFDNYGFAITSGSDGSLLTGLGSDGSGLFTGRVSAGTTDHYVTNNHAISAINNAADTTAVIFGSNVGGGRLLDLGNGNNRKLIVEGDGSVTFASNQAGFTAEGHLWCTTRRGDTVILDATSNGLATWAEYTPPTRLEQLKEMAEEWSEKDKVDDDFGVSPEDAGET